MKGVTQIFQIFGDLTLDEHLQTNLSLHSPNIKLHSNVIMVFRLFSLFGVFNFNFIVEKSDVFDQIFLKQNQNENDDDNDYNNTVAQ